MNNAPIRYGPNTTYPGGHIGQGTLSSSQSGVRPPIVEATDTLGKLLQGLEEDIAVLRTRLDSYCYYPPSPEAPNGDVPRVGGSQFLNDFQSKADQAQRIRNRVADLLSALQL